MKITVEIAQQLLRDARAVAARERTTLRALLEEGLRWVLAKRPKKERFVLRDASVGGRGLQPGASDTDWTAMRNRSYGNCGARQRP